MQMHGQTIKDWILWDKEMKSENYSNEIENGLWGGALETTIFASLLGISIHIYEPIENNKKCKKITTCYPDKTLQKYVTPLKSISILWVNKSHYMYLRIV